MRPWRTLCLAAGFAAVCLATPAVRGQDNDEGRDPQVERRGQREAHESHPGPARSDEGEFGEAAHRLAHEIETLRARLEIAESELRILHARARLKALEGGRDAPDARPGDGFGRDRRPDRRRNLDSPEMRNFRRRGPDGRRERGPEGREGPREERREGRGNAEATERALNQQSVIPFPDPTPLEDVIRYLKRATTSDALPNGLAIYVDPEGLERAKQTMKSNVSLKSDDLPLKKALDGLLSSVGLTYFVKDGVVTITSGKPTTPGDDDAERDSSK
jgi:hypothetical protein